MFKSQAGTLRTPRKVAEKIGAAPTGFEGGMPYSPYCGHPIGPGMPEQHYEGQPEPIGPSPPERQVKPFKLGG